MASLADHAVCIAYVGFAARDALRQLPIPDTLGTARARAICWGPHDGDSYRLATLRPNGLVLDCKSCLAAQEMKCCQGASGRHPS